MDVVYSTESKTPFFEFNSGTKDGLHHSSKILPVIAAAFISTVTLNSGYVSINSDDGLKNKVFDIYSSDDSLNHHSKSITTFTSKQIEGGVLEMSDNDYLTNRDLNSLKDLIDASKDATIAKVETVDAKIDTVSQKIDTSEAKLKKYIADELKNHQNQISKKNYDTTTRWIAVLAILVPIAWSLMSHYIFHWKG